MFTPQLAALRLDPQPAAGASHVWCLFPQGTAEDHLLEASTYQRHRLRQGTAFKADHALSGSTSSGALWVWQGVDLAASRFERLKQLRLSLELLLAEQPQSIALVLCGDSQHQQQLIDEACYVLWLNTSALPQRQKKAPPVLKDVVLVQPPKAEIAALARGNTLARGLALLPYQQLNPQSYVAYLRQFAAEHGFACEVWDTATLQAKGAGAFLAVAAGAMEHSALVKLSYQPEQARASVALVGKGVCFDTGGHNLKPARYMRHMHEDMTGSAVALGLLSAVAETKLDISVQCWLAITENVLSPLAYRQSDIVTAADGRSIEIVHTDAEGRLILVDALYFASRTPHDLVIDFATLTGSMETALGCRYSGVFASQEALLDVARRSGEACGERVWPFPCPSDYDEELESKQADVLQCTLEGDADHILAARLLLGALPPECRWLHVDLSASRREGGLGAVGTTLTGFGVHFGYEFIRQLLPSQENR